MVSRGLSKTRCRAMVSSTTPRLGPRWPPVLETDSTRKSLISWARLGSWAGVSALRSAGPLMVSSSPTRAVLPGVTNTRGPVLMGNRPSLCALPDLDLLRHSRDLDGTVPRHRDRELG